jgi:GLPGLI family protein
MKAILTLFLIFFINSFYAQNTKIESIKVTYNFIDHKEFRKKRMDSISKTKKNETPLDKEMVTHMDKAMEYNQNLSSYEMIATENESVFYSIKPMIPDDLHYLVDVFYTHIGKFSLYQNKLKKERFSFTKSFGGDYLVDINSNENIKTELTSETKLINDLECFKAKIFDTKNNKLINTAWYCPTIAINGGPEHCYDLPGLVLAVENNMFSIVCKNIQFNVSQEELSKIKKPKGTYITKENLNKKYSDFNDEMKILQKKN